jgi:hypothetical protein
MPDNNPELDWSLTSAASPSLAKPRVLRPCSHAMQLVLVGAGNLWVLGSRVEEAARLYAAAYATASTANRPLPSCRQLIKSQQYLPAWASEDNQ